VNADGDASLKFKLPHETLVCCETRVPGAHNAKNALACSGGRVAFSRPGVENPGTGWNIPCGKQKMETLMVGGWSCSTTRITQTRIHDCCPPHAGSDTGSGKKIAVLADMKELGAAARREHEAVDGECAALGIDPPADLRNARAAYPRLPRVSPVAIHYDQKNMLAEYLGGSSRARAMSCW